MFHSAIKTGTMTLVYLQKVIRNRTKFIDFISVIVRFHGLII